MTNETQMIDLSEVDSDALKEELNSRGDMPTIDEFDDSEISDAFYVRELEMGIDEFDDIDVENEYNKRNPSTAAVIELAEYINHRISLGQDIQHNIEELLGLVKSL